MIPYIRGKVTLQAHVDVPDGTFEEEYAREGFFGRYAHLYRMRPPVGWTSIDGPLKPRAYDLNLAEDPRHFSRETMLWNDDVEIAWVHLNTEMPYYYRNADGDDVYFVHEGKGKLETDFGPLAYEPGDYLVIPRGTVYRFTPFSASRFLNVMSVGEIRLPEKGMLGQHALIDPAMIRVPTPEDPSLLQKKTGSFELKIRRMGEETSVTYPYCPIDTVGWKGTLTVWQINVRDIRPILSDSYHLPPSAHTTFVSQGFVICTFLPRPLENGDPKAMKVPFYHSNIDYDEVLFYHSGEFFSREGIKPGMMTFHPQGIHHGPQEKAIERSKDASRTNEVAVMIDTRRPLRTETSLVQVENTNYWKSWMPKTPLTK